MAKVFCKKCGARGSSKCPHCRKVFMDFPNNDLERTAQQWLERYVRVRVADPWEKQRYPGEDIEYRVEFWTYEQSESEAIFSVLDSLRFWLPLANLKVASCIHEWSLMPGEVSSIGCGHVGSLDLEVPPDPFAKELDPQEIDILNQIDGYQD
jgi:hypothetical protein